MDSLPASPRVCKTQVLEYGVSGGAGGAIPLFRCLERAVSSVVPFTRVSLARILILHFLLFVGLVPALPTVGAVVLVCSCARVRGWKTSSPLGFVMFGIFYFGSGSLLSLFFFFCCPSHGFLRRTVGWLVDSARGEGKGRCVPFRFVASHPLCGCRCAVSVQYR